MNDTHVSPLRQRMIDDMTIRKMAPKTQAAYIRAVKNFTVFLGRSPNTASSEDLRRFQLHLASSGVSAPTQNATVTAPNLKYKAALSVAYGAGLRASEVVSLKLADIPRVKPEGRLASAR